MRKRTASGKAHPVGGNHFGVFPWVFVSLRRSFTEKKQPLSTRQRLFLFNEINPFEICEMHFVREIAEVVGGFHFTFCANRKFRND